MEIKIKDDTQTLLLTNEELNNDNFIDMELYDEKAKDKENTRGFVSECTMPISELKAGIDAFYRLREQRLSEVEEIPQMEGTREALDDLILK